MSRKESRPRGPSEHTRRDQIVTAAREHFRQFGYEKTTVGNIAKAVGVSAAYVYKFFESKQAIGNASCRLSLEDIARDVKKIVESQISVQERIRLIFLALSSHACELSLRDSKLREMILFAWQERWQAIEGYETSLEVLIRQLVEEGPAQRGVRAHDPTRGNLPQHPHKP